MTEIEHYRNRLEHCADMARNAVNAEVRELWLTVESSYRFLLDRAERIARESHPL
jgi:hypothetical protein